MWKFRTDRQYRVKEAVKALRNNPESRKEIKTWKAKITPRIAFFLWLIANKRLLMVNNLKKRGFSMVNMCVLCKKEEENIDHNILHL